MYQNPTPKSPALPDLSVLLDAIRSQIKKEINCAKIGIIQSFDAEKQEVAVKIAFQQVTSIKPDNTKTLAEYPLLLRVPVFFPSGGGYTLTFPIAAGDECLVVFNDRQIDNWLVNGAGSPPSMGRIHDISDGIAFVGIRSNPRALASVSTNAVELRADDNSSKISMGGGQLNIVAPNGVNITTPQVTVSGDVVAGGETISLVHHVHPNVQSGPSNTGEPIP